jgi:hypothetical protein
MATKGTAWLVRRSRDLVPALAGLALREWLGDIQRERVNLKALSRLSGNLRLTSG